MKCEICGKAPPDDRVALYRVNEMGVPGIWRCTEHLTKTQVSELDPIVSELVQIIEDDNHFKDGQNTP